MTQPVWKYVENLGDATPMEYGGLFVYVDETGVYPPEMEKLDPISANRFEVHRVILEPCTFIDNVLSDNKFHPTMNAWFADSLEAVSRSMDYPLDEMRADFCSDEPLKRARAWQAVYDHHGWANGDCEPRLLKRTDVKARYTKGEL